MSEASPAPPEEGFRPHAVRVTADASGSPIEYMPQDRYAGKETVPLNSNGAGPFCKFAVVGVTAEAGVYLITVNDDIKYVGECANFAQRYGLSGYGSIQPRNCYRGGQSTNCKINSRVLLAIKAAQTVRVWFMPCVDRHATESRLLAKHQPSWNGRGRS